MVRYVIMAKRDVDSELLQVSCRNQNQKENQRMKSN